MNKKLNLIIFAIVICTIAGLYYLYIYNSKIELNIKDDIITINNPYLEDKSLKWIDSKNDFIKNNWPNTFDFDYEIKKDLLENALKMPENHGIIDCGAHIGDGSIPLAHALKHNNRYDIIVYAIDPSKYKCDFIEYMKKINNLDNLIVLNYGLSDKDNIEYTYSSNKDWEKSKNTGGIRWEPYIDKTNSINRGYSNSKDDNIFIKLDTLFDKNIINHKIGVIHLDVEEMEDKAIIGGMKYISNNKPYISLEDHTNNIKKFENLLKNNYKNTNKIGSNYIYISD